MVTIAEKTIKGVLKKYPGIKITLILRFDARKDHIERHPGIDSFIFYKNVGFNPIDLLKGRLGFVKQIREKKFDILVIPNKRLKSYILGLLSKANEKWIYDVDADNWTNINIFEFAFILLRRSMAFIFGPIFFSGILLTTVFWGGARFLKYDLLKR